MGQVEILFVQRFVIISGLVEGYLNNYFRDQQYILKLNLVTLKKLHKSILIVSLFSDDIIKSIFTSTKNYYTII